MAEEGAVLGRTIDEAVERTTDRVYVASQWQLMWWRLRKHRLAMDAAGVLGLFYFVVIFANFLATSDPALSEARRGELPPQCVHFFDGFKPGLFVNAVSGFRDPVTFKRVYVIDKETKYPVRFFARGYEYKFLGIIPMDWHLLGSIALSRPRRPSIYWERTSREEMSGLG